MPNRIIKESIRTSKSVNSLSDFQFRLWLYLITYADDFGRGSADPELLKGIVFPRRKGITEQQIHEALAVLANKGMISLYEADEEPYFYFPKWGEHQRIQTKKSKYPAPPESTVNHREPPPEYNPSGNPSPNPNPNPKRESTRTRKDEEDDGFTAFWDAYPRKSGDIRSAYMEYLHVLDSGISPETLIEAIKQQTKDATSEDLHFLPGAEKWLRNRGWESKAAVRTPPKNGRPAGFTTAAEYKAPAAADINALQDMINRI